MSEFLSSTREQFAEELERLLRKADERRPVALIVSGEPGLGKSTTLETVRQRWERGEGTSVPVLDPEDIGTLSTVLDPGGGTPTLLVVDDIDQWAEADTEKLAGVISDSRNKELRLLASAQNEHPEHLHALVVQRRNLPRLPHGEVQSLLRARGIDDPTRISAIVDRSGGNPWVAQELSAVDAEQLLEDDPTGVPETVARRFHQIVTDLPNAVRRSLVVLAAADGGDLNVIDKALGVLGESMPELDRAEDSGLIRVADGRVSFTHPILRTVSYRSVGIASRRAAHAALATVMSLPAQAAGRAQHLVAAATGPDEAVADALMVLAERAGMLGMHAEAATQFERSARFSAEDLSANRCLALAALQWRAAREPIEARRLLREVDRTRLAEPILVALCELDRWLDGPAAALSRFDQVDLDAAIATAMRSALILDLFGLPTADREASSATAENARSATAAAAVAIVRCRITGTAWTEDAHEGLDPHVQRWFRTQSLNAVNESGIAPARNANSVEELLACAQDSLLRCDLVESGRSIEMARALHRDGAVGEELDLRSIESFAAQLRGNLSELDWSSDEMVRGEPAPAAWLWARGRAALDREDQDEATAIDLLRRAAGLRPELYAADLIAGLARLGRVTEAGEWLEHVPERTSENSPLQSARGLRARAVLREDDRLFRSSARVADEHGLVLDRFETLLAQAESLARRALSEEARKLAGLVRGGLGRLGLRGWNRRIDEVARSDNMPSIEDRLTPAELRVARAVAGGGTNKAVAEELFLSVKTVDYHLQNIYRKLEIRSRTELAVMVTGRNKEVRGG